MNPGLCGIILGAEAAFCAGASEMVLCRLISEVFESLWAVGVVVAIVAVVAVVPADAFSLFVAATGGGLWFRGLSMNPSKLVNVYLHIFSREFHSLWSRP